MYKKTITYEDFDGIERIEDAYFNLTKTELIEFALELPDKIANSVESKSEEMDEEKAIKKVMGAMNGKEILTFIKKLVFKSYGERKDEGRRFAKADENGRPLYIKFSETMAFETIMEEFRSNDIAAAEFVNAVIPSSIGEQMPNIKNIAGKAAAKN